MKTVLQCAIPICFVIAVSAASASNGEAPDLPESAPLPEQRPATSAEEAPQTGNAMPAEELACRSRLQALGVEYSEQVAIDETSGCEAEWPVSVTRLPGEVDLRPAGTMTCAMAEATARFVSETAAPMTQRVFGRRLAAVDQVSAYVCRPRADGSKLSEHAFANALDWGAIELDTGDRIAVRRYDRRKEPDEARFMAALRKAACGPFKTVLGPGSDADHADHFHFDLAERRNGGIWCR